ncbi:hypothetical protein N0V91_002891 [Didymella pomorum]|uniref:Uncharacterized protein n=1 Tax=Didymella pomorum TaxID=749634 RepID=A0A9W9DAY4_9PLEO|nr:hypothetical protein N0V91_002891 [Didymella pomorum]
MAKAAAPQEMQLAEILSDLVSLRPGVCDPAAALALVSARPSSLSTGASSFAPSTAAEPDKSAEEDDKDLHRAKELVALHYDVRERYKRGELTRGLAEARGAVERALG